MQLSPLKTAMTAILFVNAVNPGLSSNGGDPPKPGFNLYSKQQDIELGKQAASTVLQQYQQVQSRDLQAYVKKIGEREADKQPALITQLTSDSPFGGAETDMLLTVSRPEGLFHLIFISPESHWNETHPTFEHMVQSIHFDR